MTVALAMLTGAAIIAPHLMRLDSADAATAATIWFLTMCLRALVAVSAAVVFVLYVPATAVFQMVTHWCWHTAVPVVTTHLGLSGHNLGDLALLMPILGLSASLVSVCFGLWRATRIISAWVHHTSIGPGPDRSVIVGEHDIVVAAAGLRRPRVVVSAGALTTLDDEELAASLAHEHGHIARRHRFVMVFAEVCRALARFLPGTRNAVRELVFHLERDADRYAVKQRHHPLALATAICKAAQRQPVQAVALMALGGSGGVTRRVGQLLEEQVPPRSQAGLRVLAMTMAVLVLALSSVMTATAVAGVDRAASADSVRHCPD